MKAVIKARHCLADNGMHIHATPRIMAIGALASERDVRCSGRQRGWRNRRRKPRLRSRSAFAGFGRSRIA